jgi:hypothetical protein
VIALALLGLLGIASAAWTIGSPEDALLWGGVVLGYAVLAAAGFVASRANGAREIALVIAAAALVCGLIGIFGVGARISPIAERVDGAWRAEGPLQYSPALGLLELAALPFAMRLMLKPGRIGLAGAALCAVAGASMGLVGTRTMMALGLLTVAAAVAWPRATLGVERRWAFAAGGLAVTSAAAANAIAGSYAPPFETAGDVPRLLGLAAMLAAAVGLWALQRSEFEGADPSLVRSSLVAVPLVAALLAAGLTPDSGPQQEPVSGFAHGRVEVWEAAIHAGADRPVAGSGEQTFLAASLPYQDLPPTLFAHNLVLEDWAELGAIGACFAIAVLAFAVLPLRRAGWEPAWLLGPGVAGFVAANLLDWPWHIPASGAIFAFAAGALAAAR